MLDAVLVAGENAAQLTRQMLAYSGKGRFVLEQMDLSTQIRETVPLLKASIAHSVELRMNLAENLPLIEVDAAQIHQLIMNIVINGGEAIREGEPGAVTIKTSVQHIDDAYLRTYAGSNKSALQPGPYVLLEVHDTGCGMDDSTKLRMFDPFFTTKFMGRGLGLSAVLGIVQGHKGSVDVSSKPGQGTTFCVLLPPARKAPEPAPPKKPAVRNLATDGTVLVVDDDETVRTLAKRALERYGYTVLLAEDGEQGVEVFRRDADRIGCVILDLTMPVMSGEQALPRMRAIRADVPVILSSGFDEVEAQRRFASTSASAFLQKPYDAESLIEKVAILTHHPNSAG
jgi:CheY-like chemotaxis protein